MLNLFLEPIKGIIILIIVLSMPKAWAQEQLPSLAESYFDIDENLVIETSNLIWANEYLNMWNRLLKNESGNQQSPLVLTTKLSNSIYKIIFPKEYRDHSAGVYFNNSKIKVIYDKKGFVYLKGTSCSLVEDEVEKIISWKSRTEKTTKNVLNSMKCECLDGTCEIDISSYLPVYAKESLGKFRDYTNCFNTAFVLAGLTTVGVSPGRPDFFNSNCKKTNNPVPGDIGMVGFKVHNGKQYEHAFIFISPILGYEKPTLNGFNSYGFMDPSVILKSAYSEQYQKIDYYTCK